MRKGKTKLRKIRKARQIWQETVSSKADRSYSKEDCVFELTVFNEFFTAKAFWKQKDTILSCINADPILSWMVGKSESYAKLELLRQNSQWSWRKLPAFVLERFKGCVPTPHVNQHTETPAKPSEVLPSNGSLPEEQARPGESSAFQRAAPARHSGDCQLPTKQRPSDLRLYR